MRQRRERAHASYTARKNKLEKAERADEAAAEIEVPEDDVPDPERSTLSLALSAVALRAQAQYHSLGAAIETDLGAARRAEEAAFEADVLNRRRPPHRGLLDGVKLVDFHTVRDRGRGVPGPAFLDRRRRPRGGLGAAARGVGGARGAAAARVAGGPRRLSRVDRRRSPPASPSRIAVEAPSRRAAERRAAAGTVMLALLLRQLGPASAPEPRFAASRLTDSRRSSLEAYSTPPARHRRAGALDRRDLRRAAAAAARAAAARAAPPPAGARRAPGPPGSVPTAARGRSDDLTERSNLSRFAIAPRRTRRP